MFKLYSLLMALLLGFSTMAQNSYWTLSPSNTLAIPANDRRAVVPEQYATYRLSLNAFKTLFAAAPMEFSMAAQANPLVIELPMPNKQMAKFKVWESPVMAPGLAAQLPFIKTYTGQGIDDPTATLKVDFTQRGFHAMVLSGNGDVFIDPYFLNSFNDYVTYYKKDFRPANKAQSICKGVRNNGAPAATTAEYRAGNGTQLRTYRLAVACTAEYAAFFGGTLGAAASAITTTVNRVNGVYEKEVSVRLVLVANNNNLIFTNLATQPFTGNDDAFTLIDESQTVIDATIGNGNYDVGHTFSTGAGGLAGLGVVCFGPQKAEGVTGSAFPVGDPYDIDYVAHEVGHQFDGDHSFNGNAGACSGNRNSSTAYEVGSGTTIMSYAGICDFQDVQPNSDAFFHTISYDQIVAFTNTGNGNTCPVTTATGNGFPTVNVGTGGFTIPKGTPFTLTGSATDPNNDALTYCWEQFNLGPTGLNNTFSASGPNFRSYPPVTSPTRTFPRLTDIINNFSTFREVLYEGNTDRTFNFRLTARDNKAAGGGVQYAPLSFVVSGGSGPFLLTSQTSGGTFAGNSVQTVTWAVAGSNAAPVNCANVRITLSTDGGLTYPTIILASTPNDGSQSIIMPNISTTTARIRVECVFSNYSFFDISDFNFTITFTIPVNLIDFAAIAQKSKVLAQWKTAQEINSHSFVVERSADGTNFETAGTIAAAGNSSITKAYAFTDNNPYNGVNYYRLKIVDKDGSFKYSQVVTVKFAQAFDLQLSPNPANDHVKIVGKMLSGNSVVQLFNGNGQLVFSRTYANATTINDAINLQSYPAGVYRVKITNGENTMNKKLLVVH